MFKVILIFLFGWVIFKYLSKVTVKNSGMKNENAKESSNKKRTNSMDIQDAEYEDMD
ncbi:MAG: hypothetical protein HN729_11440 [Candidatus Marinimicrobia bacterium]|nr:hypothetical protein [Candidatus Neomarinimicrobiota bacterium]MBT3760180.1 hypothetical protein [Candidatus Neomarinimicrobiota bacterium]MBT3896275.1 hypothetical protein [Candidatus Neomarinimicrobiota bacterium]MBT4173345.1 hypothetical protein [Candidatus Neomarinimicrobiota bacterium]MBT4537951.1 hypothetical protein [Candidatus Neomarinimicrobiota bacterium]